MRITCPNCNAQYEVGEDMIPPDGRDVQCSNCGTTWFQDGRRRAATAVEERAVRRPAQEQDEHQEEADPVAEPDIAVTDPEPEPQAEPQAPIPSRHRRPIADDAMLEILREEREQEDRFRAESEAQKADQDSDPRQRAAAERARMATAATLARARDVAGPARPDADDQADAPVTHTQKGTDAAEKDVIDDVIAATMRDATVTDDGSWQTETEDPTSGQDVPAPSARAARRELLPDIEEINSSLRPDERAAEAEAANAAEGADEGQRAADTGISGFRIGFLMISAIILAMVGVYVFAGQISDSAPQLTGLLAKYVAWVDAQRLALASAAEALTARISPDT